MGCTLHISYFHSRHIVQQLGASAEQLLDYYNPESNIILEDLHDENVLTNNGILYFIDTVFYIQNK